MNKDILERVNYVNPIIKLTENCNFSCYYCRYSNNGNINDFIKKNELFEIISKCLEYNNSNGYQGLSIIFHGGEPLLWGINNFLDFAEWEKNKKILIKKSIQTNGYLLNDEWCSFFKENGFEVGVSIDGPSHLNGHKMKKYSNEEVTNRVLSNIGLLKKNNVKFGILSVLKNDNTNAKEYYDFLIKNDIHKVGFCYYYQNYKEAVSKDVLSKFLIDMFKLYFYGDYKLRIREFDNAIERAKIGKAHSCHSSDRCSCGKFISVKPGGNVVFCDSYDLECDIMGNIMHQSVADIICGDKYQESIMKAEMFYVEKCKKCSVLDLCGGGCCRNDFVLQGNLHNYFCDVYLKVYSFIRETLERY
jgi:uncharacterized protein